jgi:Ca2+-binding RTX toxin-like protein
MSSLTYFFGRPDFDWEFLLRDVLANGTFANVTATHADLQWINGGTTITLALTGTGIATADVNTINPGGDISSFSLIVNNGGANTVLTTSGLSDLSSAELQTIFDGVTGATDPTTDAFHDHIGPMFTDESVTVTGSADGDSIFGSASTDTINAGDGGFDYIRPGEGVDIVNGGAGEDFLDYGADAARVFGVVVDLAAQTVVDNDGGNNTVDIISGIEDIGGSQLDDIIAGDNNNNVLFGNAGDDTITGLDGDDYVEAGAGTDSFDGGDGWDKLSYQREAGGHGIIVNYTADGTGTVSDTFQDTDTFSNVEGIKGSRYADTFNGSAGDETWEGLAGNDIFHGGNGWDQVDYQFERDVSGSNFGILINLSNASVGHDFGDGRGTVTVLGGNGRDSFDNTDTFTGIEGVQGTFRDDYVVGDANDNELEGGDGSDTLIGGDGNDNLRGDDGGGVNQGNDQLLGGDGDDRFKGGAGADHFDGGNGRDTVHYNLETTFTGDDATHGVIVNLSNADLSNVTVAGIPSTTVAAHTAIDTRNYLDTLVSIEQVIGTGYADILVGDDGDNDLEANAGNDTVRAGGGNFDHIRGGSGTDQVFGDAGHDQLDFSGRSSTGIDVTLTAGTAGAGGVVGDIQDDDVPNPLAVNTTFQGIEQVVGSDADDSFTGITGFLGTTEAYRIDDGTHAIQVTGMDGADIFADNSIGHGVLVIDYDQEKWGHGRFQNGGESLGPWGSQPGEFGVIVNLSAAAVAVDIGNGLDSIGAGQGRDTFGALDAFGGARLFLLTDARDFITGGSQGIIVNGNGGDDTLAGSSARDLLFGDDGNDTVNGQGSNDDLFGGNGNDTLGGGGGNDFMQGESGNDTLNGGDGSDTLNDGTGSDTLRGGFGSDTFIGGAGNDTMDGGGGIDTINYGAEGGPHGVRVNLLGNATQLGIPHDTAFDSFGFRDTIPHIGNVIGTRFADTLLGGNHANLLSGGAGNDTLAGGGGIDTLTGGAGSDFFIFNAALSAANRDIITDFNHAADTFRLENAVMTALGVATGALKASSFFAGAKAHDADDHIIYNRATGGLFYDSNGIVAGGTIQLATLTNKPTLLANDFLVI